MHYLLFVLKILTIIVILKLFMDQIINFCSGVSTCLRYSGIGRQQVEGKNLMFFVGTLLLNALLAACYAIAIWYIAQSF